MCFSETIKLNVQKRADFTCCWCNNRLNKIEVHHIIPQADDGPNTEDNAAPLCGSCHTLFGGNPELRKQIKARRDHWYEICLKRLEFAWSPNLHIPLLDSCELTIPIEEKTTLGTNIREDWPRFKFFNNNDNQGTSPLQIAIGYLPEVCRGLQFPKLLSVRIEIPFGLVFNLSINAESHWDSVGFIDTIRGKRDIWMLKSSIDQTSPIDPMYQHRDYFTLLRMNNGENRLMMRAFLPTEASIGFRARLTDKVLNEFSLYLEEKGFTK